MKKLKGIDISSWQGNVDFNKVKKSGIEFLILREGYGKQTADEKFFTYVKGAKAADIPIYGVYHFSYALNASQAAKEAEVCIKNVKAAGLDSNTIIFFDFEYDTVKYAAKCGVTLGRKQCNEHTKAFCETIESKGYMAGIYCNIDYYKNWYDHDLLSKHIFWLADWTGDADYPCQFHQYSSSGKIDGIKGNVDMNFYFEDSSKETVTTPPTKEEAKKETEDKNLETPFLVKVNIKNLRIRKGPGTNTNWIGIYTGIGVFTIMDVKQGPGSVNGWGLLKSYAAKRNGWISLDYATKLKK